MQRLVVAGSALAFIAAATVSALALATALPARGGAETAPREDPGSFLIRTVSSLIADDYARIWPDLHPAHQQVATRNEYVACELKTPVGWKLRSAEVLRVVERLRRIPGEANDVSVTSVTLRLRIANPSLRTEGGFTHTFTAVAVGDRWTWVLTPSKYRLYRANAC